MKLFKQDEEPSSRRIKLKTLPNTRDLSDVPNQMGLRIKPHRLIRSGTLGGAGRRDIKTLTKEYGLKQVVDFRNEEERESNPDPAIAGVKNDWSPILNERALGITREDDCDESGSDDCDEAAPSMGSITDFLSDPKKMITRLYAAMPLDKFTQNQYRKFLKLVENNTDGAVLYHCTAGKDRVGIGTALILSALGYDRESIIKDYLKTNENLGVPGLSTGVPHLEDASNDLYILLNSAYPEYIDAAFDSIDKNYGTVENYLHEALELTDEDIEKLKENYLEK